MKLLFFVLLGFIMVFGSITSVLNVDATILQQYNNGIPVEELTCTNPSHVLVMRTNDKVACVTERTAEKLGWEIITENSIIPVEYEFPLTAKQPEMTYSQNGESLIGSNSKIELQISNLPKLGESAVITVIVTNNLPENDMYEDDMGDAIQIGISSELQVMTGLEDFTQTHFGENGNSRYYKEFLIGSNQIHTFKITVVALGTGEIGISVLTSGDDPRSRASFELVIGENETLLKDDYYKKYPSALTAKLASIESVKQLALDEEKLEEEKLLAQGCQFVEQIGMWCPPTDEEMEAMRNDTDHQSIDSEEELRAYLKADGATYEEIEEIVREAYPKTIVLNLSSPVEFTHDGREIKRSTLQRAPAPGPIYDRIMNGMTNDLNIGDPGITGLVSGVPVSAAGVATFTIIPHEKYSINPKQGFYLEDWLPTFIPDGQKLLYSETTYTTFMVNEKQYESYGALYQFVPTTFVLQPGMSTHDLQVSKGFEVIIKYRTLPFDEVEDGIEFIKESRARQSGNIGGFIDMMRDGKTVMAFEGSNDYNHYQSTLYYLPDENMSVGVRSNYHTLDELIPIFENIMN